MFNIEPRPSIPLFLSLIPKERRYKNLKIYLLILLKKNVMSRKEAVCLQYETKERLVCLDDKETNLHLKHEIVNDALLCTEQEVANAELILLNKSEVIMEKLSQLNEPQMIVESVNLLNKSEVMMKLNELQMIVESVNLLNKSEVMMKLNEPQMVIEAVNIVPIIKLEDYEVTEIKVIEEIEFNGVTKKIERRITMIPKKKESFIEKCINFSKNIKEFIDVYLFIAVRTGFILSDNPTILELIKLLKRLIGH